MRIVTVAAAGALIFGAPAVSAAQADGGALRVVELSGSPRARGLAHGKALKPEIRLHVERWKAQLAAQAKGKPDELIAAFLSETRFVDAAKRWTPDLLEEVKGIAEGADLPFDTVFALQLLDELWSWVEDKTGNHCSSVGVAGRGTTPAFVAQNMDLEGYRDGFQTVLRIKGGRSSPEQLVFTAAGVIALNGMNDRSIAVVVNTLSQLSSSRDGLPVAFVIRGVLARKSGAEAIRFLQDVKHASGQNYILGAGDVVYDFEASATKVVSVAPRGAAGVVYHTNHPVANDDYKAWWVDWLKSHPDARGATNSDARYGALEKRVGNGSSFSSEDAKKAMQSKDSVENPVCRAHKDDTTDYTFGSTVMTLSDTPAFEVTAGPPDKSAYRRFELAAHGAKGPRAAAVQGGAGETARTPGR